MTAPREMSLQQRPLPPQVLLSAVVLHRPVASLHFCAGRPVGGAAPLLRQLPAGLGGQRELEHGSRRVPGNAAGTYHCCHAHRRLQHAAHHRAHKPRCPAHRSQNDRQAPGIPRRQRTLRWPSSVPRKLVSWRQCRAANNACVSSSNVFQRSRRSRHSRRERHDSASATR